MTSQTLVGRGRGGGRARCCYSMLSSAEVRVACYGMDAAQLPGEVRPEMKDIVNVEDMQEVCEMFFQICFPTDRQ